MWCKQDEGAQKKDQGGSSGNVAANPVFIHSIVKSWCKYQWLSWVWDLKFFLVESVCISLFLYLRLFCSDVKSMGSQKKLWFHQWELHQLQNKRWTWLENCSKGTIQHSLQSQRKTWIDMEGCRSSIVWFYWCPIELSFNWNFWLLISNSR